MQRVSEVFRRNRTVIMLFTVLVIVPSLLLGYVGFRSIRADDVQERFLERNRQREIGVLFNAELKNWLFSTASDGASSQALIRFTVDGDRIVLPEAGASSGSQGLKNPVPLARASEENPPSSRDIAEIYYPRIQFFLRDLRLKQNPGAQY